MSKQTVIIIIGLKHESAKSHSPFIIVLKEVGSYLSFIFLSHRKNILFSSYL